MVTNDLKKGTRVLLRNGWYGTIRDNARGATRLVEVEGTYTDTGSVYAHDIIRALVNGAWVQVQHTETQTKLRARLDTMFR